MTSAWSGSTCGAVTIYVLLVLCQIQAILSANCFEKNTAYPGNSMDAAGETQLTATSAKQCQELCQDTPGCAAFTFVKKKSFCNLKSTQYGEKRKKAGKVSGPANCPEENTNVLSRSGSVRQISNCFKEGVNFQVGNLPGSQTRNTAEECQQLCQDTPGCHSFSWERSSKNCGLKSSDKRRRKKNDVVSGPAHCGGGVGGTCPPPQCVKKWKYNGVEQKGCADPGGSGYMWCPTSTGLDSSGNWISGSQHYAACVAPTYCVKNWKFRGQDQRYCSSVISPGRPWCPTQSGVNSNGEFIGGRGSYIYCTPDMCLDPISCDLPTRCQKQWKYKGVAQVHCSTVASPGRPWCPGPGALDASGNYNGGEIVWCRRNTCSRTPCGTNAREFDQHRVVGGRPADPNEWPWLAALVYPEGDSFCGGTLISDTYVITAAHCVVGQKKADIQVKLGEYDFAVEGETNDRAYAIENIKMHESYSTETQDNDIAIIKLAAPSTINKSVWPICLPPPQKEFTNERAFVVGWGTIYYGGQSSDTLLEANIRVWDTNVCKANYAKVRKPLTDSMMCAGDDKKDACQGDSGGPLNCKDPVTGRWQLCGVVSWGLFCAEPEYPGVYTTVNKFLPWIRDNMVESEKPFVFN